MKGKNVSIDNLELRIYSFLGIRFFQKLVFRLERFIHRKDGNRNQNYHFALNHISPMEDFIKFLFFNGSIHLRNVCFFILYGVIKKFFFEFYWYDVLLFLLFIKDIYCIMLQRYNYLRIKKANMLSQRRRENNINKKINEWLPLFQANYDNSNIKSDLELIHKIKDALENKSIIVLDTAEEETLKRLINVIDKYNL